MFASEELPRPPKTRGDFIRDEQHAELIAKRAYTFEILRRVEPHPPSTLYDRLKNNRRHLGGMGFENSSQIGEIGCFDRLPETPPGLLRKKMLCEHTLKKAMHSRHGITYSHRTESVAVIAASNRQHPGPVGFSPRLPDLQRHLDRYLHRNRS